MFIPKPETFNPEAGAKHAKADGAIGRRKRRQCTGGVWAREASLEGRRQARQHTLGTTTRQEVGRTTRRSASSDPRPASGWSTPSLSLGSGGSAQRPRRRQARQHTLGTRQQPDRRLEGQRAPPIRVPHLVSQLLLVQLTDQVSQLLSSPRLTPGIRLVNSSSLRGERRGSAPPCKTFFFTHDRRVQRRICHEEHTAL